MSFKIDPVALVLDVFTFGCWSAYWNIQRITNIDNDTSIYNKLEGRGGRMPVPIYGWNRTYHSIYTA